jgi:PAS domain S-box-containing protein
LKGTPKWWSVIISPIYDKSGRVHRLLSVSRDITLQKDRENILQERIKELNCIKELSDLVEKNETIEGILNSLAPVIQKSFLHPEKTNVRITLNRKTFMTHNFMETNHVLSSEIHKYNKTVGKIEVFYFTKEALNEAPFLEEEKNLLEILVKRLGYIIERQEDEKKWKEIFNSTSEAIIIHDDKTGKMVDCNDVTVDMYGYESKEEMVSRDVNDFSSTRIQYHQDEIIKHLKKAVTEGSHTFEWLAKKKSGEEFWVEVSLKRTTIEGEGMLLSVVRDIADRKQAELSLQESWQNLKQAQQIARLGNWELDHTINKLTWSDEIFRIFNCEPQEFKATYEAFLEFVHPDDREKVDTIFKKSLQTKQPYEIIHRLLLEDGSIRHVKEKCDTIFDQTGKPINSKGIVLDITEIKEKESKLQQYSVKLEELNATKDKFFSIVSHDLKNPFNAIMGFAALAIEKLKNKEYEKVGRYCELIYQNTKHSDNLLKNLLQWSRLQREKTDFTAEQMNLQHIVNNIAGLHKANYQEKNIQLHIHIPGNLFVNTDSFMLETTIRNLLSNAIKYTHKGGRVEILAVQENDKTRISVKDNGVGIKQEHKGKLFRIESSYSTPGTGNEKGTGLGLILCKEFVEKLGGNIWVESQEGKGTTFHFTVKNEI